MAARKGLQLISKSFLKAVFLLVFIVLILHFFFTIIIFFKLKISREEKRRVIAEKSVVQDNSQSFKEVSLFMAGDVMLGRTVMIKAYERGNFIFPFEKVAGGMKAADITFFNLENPVLESCPYHESGYTFCATPKMLEGLVVSGVDVVNLANNHILNYGNEGLEETRQHLDERNILATGVGDLVTVVRRGVVFGFLGFDKAQLTHPKLTQDEVDLIIASDSKVDVLLVSMHWGVEYQDKALPGVRALAKEIVGYGADVIVGHHSHWVQDWEYIEIEGHDKVPVFYSLGNFIFDQMWSEETKKGLVVKLTYDEEGNMTKYKLLPTYMSSWSKPEFEEN